MIKTDNNQQLFLKYVRAKMILSLGLRSSENTLRAVFIPSKEIEERFFPFPHYNRKNEIQALQGIGEIRVIQVGKSYRYEALKPGAYDLNLLLVKKIPQDKTLQRMLKNIQKVSLPPGAPSTHFFDLFLKYRDLKPELFLKVDDFCGRVHTPISNFHRSHRPNILIDSKKTISLDVATMQPLLLGKLLFNKIGANEYSTWINEGKDIYIELKNKALLFSRDEAKKKLFEVLFSKPNETLKEMFGASDWVNWINNYKQIDEPLNPHGKERPHTNLAWLLQNTEVMIMKQVWCELVNCDLPFLSVHDEIIVKETDYQKAKALFESVLRKEFEYFKLNTKDAISEPGPVDTQKQVKTSKDEKQRFTAINQTSPKINFKPFTKEFTPIWDITELESDYKGLQVPQQPIKINQYGMITNVRNFIDSHFEIIKHNNGNPVFAPYYQRLIELKLILKTGKNGN